MNPEESNRYAAEKGYRYHDTDECNKINHPERFVPRSVEYVEWRDMDACKFCHDQLETPTNGESNWSYQNALQEAAKND